jgi:hypothetical protein
VAVDPGPCATLGARALVLRGPQGQVLWRAAGASPDGGSLAPFTVGRAPAGFHDTVPLASPLRAGVAYAVEVSVLEDGSSTTLPPEVALAFGARGAFRPGDLAPGRIWFAGRSLTPAEFSRAACAARAASA